MGSIMVRACWRRRAEAGVAQQGPVPGGQRGAAAAASGRLEARLARYRHECCARPTTETEMMVSGRLIRRRNATKRALSRPEWARERRPDGAPTARRSWREPRGRDQSIWHWSERLAWSLFHSLARPKRRLACPSDRSLGSSSPARLAAIAGGASASGQIDKESRSEGKKVTSERNIY